jgi:hypothetical protein
MSSTETTRERRPSTSAPISDLQGPVGPGFSRPKHKRTFTGFGAGEIKSVEGIYFISFSWKLPRPLMAIFVGWIGISPASSNEG